MSPKVTLEAIQSHHRLRKVKLTELESLLPKQSDWLHATCTTQCWRWTTPDAADVVSSASVIFHQREVHIKKILLYNRRTSPSNSQEFRPIILDQCGRVRLRAPGAPVCWAPAGPPQRSPTGLFPLPLKVRNLVLRHKLFILVRCPSEEDCTWLQVFIHLLCCCSHLTPQAAISKMAAPSFWVSACCSKSSAPGETWSPQRCCWLDFCASFSAEASWAAGGQQHGESKESGWRRTKTTSHHSSEHLLQLEFTSLLRVRSSWDAGIAGAMLDLCAAEASAETTSSQPTTSLLFLVPHLHMNAWVSVRRHFLTLSANHRGGWEIKGGSSWLLLWPDGQWGDLRGTAGRLG